jgi:hypothetical protein
MRDSEKNTVHHKGSMAMSRKSRVAIAEKARITQELRKNIQLIAPDILITYSVIYIGVCKAIRAF